jgi:protein-tyrosine phosphatase
LARFALFAESNLDQGNSVVVHCRHGLHRTGLAIYLLLRLIMGEPEECLSMMEEMRPTMHKEFVHRQLHSKAETILADSRFTSPWYLASRQARPRA